MFQTDPFSGTLVAFSSHRGKRPHFPKVCPFCLGSEHVTPPATLVLPVSAQFELPVRSNSKGQGIGLHHKASGKNSNPIWSVRCFPNAFPIVSGKFGRHEVIVETAEHGALWEDLTHEQLALVFEAYQDRFRALLKEKNGTSTPYVLLFKNFGQKSGASIDHEHAQVVSFPFVPVAVANEVKKSGVLDRWAQVANAVCENDFFKAICPPVSRFPYEVWILSKDKSARFEDFSTGQGLALLSLMQSVIRKIKKVQGAPDYTVAFHAAPPGKRLRFHVEIVPRKAVWGGFELGSGVLVNFKAPHRAWRDLRQA